MYEPVYTIRKFSEYSLERSKMPVFLVKSRQQFKVPLPGHDGKASDLCRKLTFKQKNYFSFRNQYNAQ